MDDMDFLASQIASILNQTPSEDGTSDEAASAPQEDSVSSASAIEDTVEAFLKQEPSDYPSAPIEESPAPQEESLPAESSPLEEMIASFLREEGTFDEPKTEETPEPKTVSPPSAESFSSPEMPPVPPAPDPIPEQPAPTPVAPAPVFTIPVPATKPTPPEDTFSFESDSHFEEDLSEKTQFAKGTNKSAEYCKDCGDRIPCNCSRYNRYDFSFVIVTLITSWISWLFLDYTTLLSGGEAFSCIETFVAFCIKQDFSLLIQDFRFILPLMAMIMNFLVALFIILNKPKLIRWVDLFAKLTIIVVSIIAAGALDILLETWVADGFMLGGTIWWLATTVMNFLCGFTFKRGPIVTNVLRKGK